MRFYGHFEGDPQAYRSREELSRVREQGDCLKKFREAVRSQGIISHDELDKIDTQVMHLIDDAVAKARSAEFPGLDKLLADVYVSYE